MPKRGRVLSNSISLSTTIADLGDSDYIVLASWLPLHADDQGRLEADPRRLKAQVAPLLPWIDEDVVAAALQRMAEVGYIVLYQHNGTALLQLVSWWRWNGRLDYTTASEYPPPEEWVDCPPGKGMASSGEYGFPEIPGISGKVAQLRDKKSPPTPIPDPTPIPGEGDRKGEGEKAPPKRAKKPPGTPPRDAVALRALFAALSSVCGVDPVVKRNRGKLNKAAAELYDAGRRCEDVQAFGTWWRLNDWRGKKDQPPTIGQLLEAIGRPGEAHGPGSAPGQYAYVFEERCDAPRPGKIRDPCCLPAGHDGPHRGHGATWDNEPVKPPSKED